MRKLLLAFLLAAVAPLLHGIVPATNVTVNLTTRDLLLTNGDSLGFNLPAWPMVVKSGGVFEFASGSTLKLDVGSSVVGFTATPAGGAGTLQYNNSGALGGTTGLTWNGLNLTGLANPVNASDAANKTYVDTVAVGLVVRTSVVVATTGNITLSGTQTIDGIAVVATNRVLVKNQATTSQNGIYDCAAGAWSRSSDSNTAGQLKVGYYYFVSSGTTLGGSGWTISTAPVVLGTDPVVFSQFSTSASYTAGANLVLAGSQFSLNPNPSVTTETAAGAGTYGNVVVNGTSANTSLLVGAIAPATAGAAYSVQVQGSTRAAATNDSLYQLYLGGGFNKNAQTGLSVYGIKLPTAPLSGSGSISTSYGISLDDVNQGTANYAIKTGLGQVSFGDTTKILGTNGEFGAGYGFFTKPIAAFDSASGGIYFGYASGAGIIRSVSDNSGTGAPIAVLVGGTQVGTITSGGWNGPLGQTTPDLGTFTIVSWQSNTGLRTTKTNAHIILNVKDYGALGDGATNDTAAINLAIAAMTNYSTLYFPAGKYLITAGSLTNLTNLNNITITGDGRSSALYSSAASPAASPFFVLAATCDLVTVQDFSIVGSATVRTSGNHGLVVYSAHTIVKGLYITGTGDFGIYVGSGGSLYNKEVQVIGCLSDRTLGDGFHFGPVTDSGLYNCQSYFTGDDGVGIGDDGGIGFPATRIEIVGFQSIQAGNHAGGGTHGAGIRIFDGATDVHVTGGAIYQSCEAGVTTGRFYTTNTYNTRIKLDGVKVYQCLQNAGMYGNFNFQWANQLSLTGCWSEAPVSQGCYGFLDCNNVTVTGCTGKDAVLRNFVTDDGTTTNVAATWSNWTFMGNVCLGTPSNESYYFVPATGKTITNLLITGNTETGQSTANYIFTNRLAGTCKINNNTSLGGKAVANGGSGVAPTNANNN